MTTIDLLEQLRIDHDNARRLLDLLAAELANVRREGPADFTLMRDIMQYLTHYPDLVHHPAEEELVQRLCEVSTERAGLQRRLVRQRIGADHRNLSEKGRAFFDTVSRVVDGGLTARADLVGTGTAYIEAQRAHMDWEEHHLFPPAGELGPRAIGEVLAQVRAHTDPLFGPILQAEYANLWQHIQHQKV